MSMMPEFVVPYRVVEGKEGVWLCRCDWGREMYVCGECLRAGRITACPECERDADER
jgi:hypothetical protein